LVALKPKVIDRVFSAGSKKEEWIMVFKEQTFHGLRPEVEVEMANRATLEAAVANALAVAGGVDASDVEVTAEGCDITLSGFVGSVGEIERATAVAQAVEGVDAVRNQILLSEQDGSVQINH
jgi:hypothetical protein